MKSTKITKKAQEAKREAARLRKQKSRASLEANGMHRVYVSIGQMDKNAILAIGDYYGKTPSEIVSILVESHILSTPDGRMPQEAGCLWESTEADLDITVTKEIHHALTRYGTLMTPGEIIEILIGLELDPTWDSDDPTLLGSFVDGDDVIIEPTKMMSHPMAYWRRRNRRYQQAIALGKDREEVWPDWGNAFGRAMTSHQSEWAYGATKASRHDVKASDFDSNVVYLNWSKEPALDLDDLLEAA